VNKMQSYLSQLRKDWNRPLNKLRNNANKKLRKKLKEDEKE